MSRVHKNSGVVKTRLVLLVIAAKSQATSAFICARQGTILDKYHVRVRKQSLVYSYIRTLNVDLKIPGKPLALVYKRRYQVIDWCRVVADIYCSPSCVCYAEIGIISVTLRSTSVRSGNK